MSLGQAEPINSSRIVRIGNDFKHIPGRIEHILDHFEQGMMIKKRIIKNKDGLHLLLQIGLLFSDNNNRLSPL
jgi:hypothetical protein